MVRDQELAERLQVALIENMVREDLNPVDEARACAALVDDLGLSKEELARRVGRSRPAVSNLIRLLDLPDEALDLLESGELSEGHGRALLGAQGNDVRRRLARDAARGGWSVRETENRAKLAGQPKKSGSARGPRISPEEAAAIREAADELESALGHEVKVRPRRGGRSRWRSASTVSMRLSPWPAASAPARLAALRPWPAAEPPPGPPTIIAWLRAISSVG